MCPLIRRFSTVKLNNCSEWVCNPPTMTPHIHPQSTYHIHGINDATINPNEIKLKLCMHTSSLDYDLEGTICPQDYAALLMVTLLLLLFPTGYAGIHSCSRFLELSLLNNVA